MQTHLIGYDGTDLGGPVDQVHAVPYYEAPIQGFDNNEGAEYRM